jgi:hypothetical protein
MIYKTIHFLIRYKKASLKDNKFPLAIFLYNASDFSFSFVFLPT